MYVYIVFEYVYYEDKYMYLQNKLHFLSVSVRVGAVRSENIPRKLRALGHQIDRRNTSQDYLTKTIWHQCAYIRFLGQ